MIGLKSSRSFSISGIRSYRMTRYPTSVSNASRFASCSSRFLWLLSSSSMIANTLSLRSHKTKSVTFWLNVPRVDRCLVSSSAENATCAKTIFWGNASLIRKNIVSSRAVSGRFARRSRCISSGSCSLSPEFCCSFSVAVSRFCFPFLPAAISTTAISTKNNTNQIEFFITISLFVNLVFSSIGILTVYFARGLRRLYRERLITFRFAALTCPQMIAAIATVTMASTAQSQCSTMSNIASISSSLVGQLVFLLVAVFVASVLLALCIFHYVIDSRVRGGQPAPGGPACGVSALAGAAVFSGHPDGNHGEINFPSVDGGVQ